jgi:hypothetical protein
MINQTTVLISTDQLCRILASSPLGHGTPLPLLDAAALNKSFSAFHCFSLGWVAEPSLLELLERAFVLKVW